MRKTPDLPSEAAVFVDVDGTLVDIAERPELVHVPLHLPKLLFELGRRRNGALALVSGRSLAQIDALFAPWQGAAAGLHGSERRRADGVVERAEDREAATALDLVRPALRELHAADPRLLLEEKGATIALHFRSAPERETEIQARASDLCATAGAPLRLIKGKMVVEFQPARRNKGAAVAAFLAEPPFRGRLPVFVGDDTTDEDGFAEVNRRGGLSVRVGPSVRVGTASRTAANHALPSVAAVLAWLAGSTGGAFT